MQPLRLVEEPSFIELIKRVQPKRNVLSRPTLTLLLNERFIEMKNKIREQLTTIQYVGTTADVWSASRRSFLGMTVHWLDPITLNRKSAAISCFRLKGTHDYLALARRINEIHCSYNIQNKVFFLIILKINLLFKY